MSPHRCFPVRGRPPRSHPPVAHSFGSRSRRFRPAQPVPSARFQKRSAHHGPRGAANRSPQLGRQSGTDRLAARSPTAPPLPARPPPPVPQRRARRRSGGPEPPPGREAPREDSSGRPEPRLTAGTARSTATRCGTAVGSPGGGGGRTPSAARMRSEPSDAGRAWGERGGARRAAGRCPMGGTGREEEASRAGPGKAGKWPHRGPAPTPSTGRVELGSLARWSGGERLREGRGSPFPEPLGEPRGRRGQEGALRSPRPAASHPRPGRP